jgi:segregation and condensation protein A
MNQEEFITFIFSEEEITWKQSLFELVRREQMDPWDIDIGVIAGKFLDFINKLKEMDFRITGKMVLAAALLLRLKSLKLLGSDLEELDRLIAGNTVTEDEFYDELEQQKQKNQTGKWEGQPLIPRTPQPRQRKVSIYDLVNALEQALEVKKRRIMNSIPAYEHVVPDRKIEISVVIDDVYKAIVEHYRTQNEKLTFSMLLPGEERIDKIYTFIPLLHLSNQRKIDLEQEAPFAEIRVLLLGAKGQTDQEVNAAIS